MPLPTPADAIGIFQQWALEGMAVVSGTSGDPGCGDPGLVDNAVHVIVTPNTGEGQRDVYLFLFRNRVRWQDAGPAVDACQRAFESRNSRRGGAVDRIDVSPFRAFGDSWSPALKAALVAGLAEASGDGGVPTGADTNLTPQPTAPASP
jgi:hypothetical protein